MVRRLRACQAAVAEERELLAQVESAQDRAWAAAELVMELAAQRPESVRLNLVAA